MLGGRATLCCCYVKISLPKMGVFWPYNAIFEVVSVVTQLGNFSSFANDDDSFQPHDLTPKSKQQSRPLPRIRVGKPSFRRFPCQSLSIRQSSRFAVTTFPVFLDGPSGYGYLCCKSQHSTFRDQIRAQAA